MNCPYCHTPNHPQSTYCVSCRQNIFNPNFHQPTMAQPASVNLQPSDKTVKWIIILISFFVFENLLDFLVNFGTSLLEGNYLFADLFYRFSRHLIPLITIGICIGFITQTKNKSIKTALIAFSSVTAFCYLFKLIF
jgi:hypothetical protein